MGAHHTVGHEGQEKPHTRDVKRVLEIIGLVLAVPIALTTIGTFVYNTWLRDTKTPAYQRQAIETCKAVLALRNQPNLLSPAFEPGPDGMSINRAKYQQIARFQLDREKAALDEFMAKPAPNKLAAKKKDAQSKINDWYGYAINIMMPKMISALPENANQDQFQSAAMAETYEYSPKVAALNTAMSNIAGNTCTAMRP
jgi:hypothetical protein